MRLNFSNHLFFGALGFYILFLLLTGSAQAGVEQVRKVAQIYPTLHNSETDSQSRQEAIKLILHEMGYAYSQQDALIRVYAARNYKPLWVTPEGISVKAKEMIDVLDKSWTHGFNPENYNLRDIRALASAPDFLENVTQMAVFELMLSESLSRFTLDMTSIRIDPDKVHIDSSHWRDPEDPVNILHRLADSKEPQKVIKSLYPDNALYTELRLALIEQVQELESFSGRKGFLTVTEQDMPLIRPGGDHPLVPHIRSRLMNEAGISNASISATYDTHMYHMVKRFQRRHNIHADGVIGPDTLRLVHRDGQARLNQIIANMERLRWIDFNRPDKYIVVNVPSARLWAIDKGRIQHQMPVVVGRPDRPTQSFVASIKGVRLNPSWTIPQKIKVEDLYEEISEDPEVLSSKNIDLYDGYGSDAQKVTPASLNVKNLKPHDLRSYNMVQRPGPDNPLGKYRFLMFNQYNIYIHDTNQPELFGKSYRAHSSGCIRVAKPAELAEFVMSDSGQWSEEAQEIRVSGEEKDFRITEDIPVYILYLSMWTQRDGSLTWGADIYGYDSQLIESLRHKNAIFTPETHPEWVTSLNIFQNKG